MKSKIFYFFFLEDPRPRERTGSFEGVSSSPSSRARLVCDFTGVVGGEAVTSTLDMVRPSSSSSEAKNNEDSSETDFNCFWSCSFSCSNCCFRTKIFFCSLARAACKRLIFPLNYFCELPLRTTTSCKWNRFVIGWLTHVGKSSLIDAPWCSLCTPSSKPCWRFDNPPTPISGVRSFALFVLQFVFRLTSDGKMCCEQD